MGASQVGARAIKLRVYAAVIQLATQVVVYIALLRTPRLWIHIIPGYCHPQARDMQYHTRVLTPQVFALLHHKSPLSYHTLSFSCADRVTFACVAHHKYVPTRRRPCLFL